MEIRHLRYFVVAAEEENFHRAAERLHVTQPALSRRIRDLEQALGVDLFERRNKRVSLTAAGHAYREDISAVLGALDKARSRARSMAAGESGSLVLGINDSVIRNPLVPRALRAFSIRYPDVELKLETAARPSLVDAVLGGGLDAAFVYSRPPGERALAFVRIASDRYVLALPGGHPLATVDRIRLQDLRGEQCLWMRREIAPALHDRLIAACQAGGLTPRIVQYAASEATRLQLVAAGMGFTFVTATMQPVPAGVTMRPLADLDLTLDLDLIWRGDANSPVLGRFIDLVRGLGEVPAAAPGLA
ncbi:MAG: LysR family transcriptional regulator [Gammaproteobacteria bacterium]